MSLALLIADCERTLQELTDMRKRQLVDDPFGVFRRLGELMDPLRGRATLLLLPGMPDIPPGFGYARGSCDDNMLLALRTTVNLKAWAESRTPSLSASTQKAPPDNGAATVAKKAQKAVESLLGEDAQKILAIVHQPDKTASDKAEEVCEIDRRYLVWESPQWADLLGCTDAAIRKGRFWKKYRPEQIAKHKARD